MRNFIVKEDCFCQGYLHERDHYPRDGLKEKKLTQGEQVQFIKEWFNFYGSYIRVKKDDILYDLFPWQLEPV